MAFLPPAALSYNCRVLGAPLRSWSKLYLLGFVTASVSACGDDSTPLGDEVADEVGDAGEHADEAMGDDEAASDSGTGMQGDEGQENTCDPTSPTIVEHELMHTGESIHAVKLGACERHIWWLAAAAGVQLEIAIDLSAPITAAVTYPDDPSFAGALATGSFDGPSSFEFLSPRSGEFALIIEADDPSLASTYDLSLTCTGLCTRETTRFPIVMVHGWTGFENIGPLTYYFNVRDDLEQLGYPIAIPILDPYNAVEVRGEQLTDFVAQTLSGQRARKVNLIGHSQGGIDSRYAAAEAGGGLGDRVGAVITIGTPHQGTPFTDIALGLIPGPSEQVMVFLLNFLGAAQNQQSDVEASFYTLSETFMQGEFNLVYVDDPRVKYWSWTGDTCIGGLGCADTLDPLMLFSYQTIYAVAGANDGLVPNASAQWGEFLGLIPADHIDQIGQIGGVTGPSYDHIQFFRDNARMLAANEL